MKKFICLFIALAILSFAKSEGSFEYLKYFNSESRTNDFVNLYSEGFYTHFDKHGSVETFHKKESSPFAENIAANVTYDSVKEFTVRVSNVNKKPRFEMPHQYPFSYNKVKAENLNDAEYSVSASGPTFSVKRISTGETIFDNSAFDFLFSDYYIEFTTKLPSKYLYGFGERARSFLFDTGVYTLWNKDQFAMIDKGEGNQQTYGFHPVYLMREASGKWHMVYLRTTNAMDIYFDASKKTLKYSTTGEFLELKFFIGDEYPDTVIKMYHNYINGWAVQPFWSHGYHQCRWGYLYMNNFTDVSGNMSANGLPMDAIWSDIDYMNNFTDFTVDADRYPLKEFKDFAKKVHWIPIIDAGVFLNYTTPSYNTGNKYNVWIRSAMNNSNFLLGIVWPGLTYYPDWLNPNASKYWDEMLTYLYDQVPFSGIWLDMNENSNFCQGEFSNTSNCFILPNYLPNGPSDHIDPRSTEINPIPLGNITNPPIQPGTPVDPAIMAFNSSKLPYLPGKTPLEYQTISINALHHGGILEFDFHNLNGFYESQYTYETLYKLRRERPFILSRASHVGSGQFATHWTGDNTADWTMLKISIPTIFNFQLFGIPMTGADICGFVGNTTAELCARWMQLGAFYPFMRNHNKIDAIDQEPYALGGTVLQTSRAALSFRYSILKFYYSVFIRNHQQGTVFRPLFFDFPFDEALLSLETQFLIGSELMVAAVVEAGKTQIPVYFPGGSKWYDFNSGKLIANEPKGINMTVQAPLNTTLPVFIKSGSIVHTQNVYGIVSSADLDNKFNLIVALNPVMNTSVITYAAKGQIMGIKNYQKDDSIDECLGNNDCMVNITVQALTNDEVNFDVTVNFNKSTPVSILEEIYVGGVTFYGVRTKICVFTVCRYEEKVVNCPNPQPKAIKYGQISYKLNNGLCSTSMEEIAL